MIRLKELRKIKKITQQELADYLNITQATLSGWESGKFEIDYSNLFKCAEFFGVSIGYILGQEEIPPKRKGVKIPVYGKVAAGIPIEAIEDVIDYEEINEDMARNGEYIALQIKGDSMEPRILDGDTVIVRLQPNFNNGDTVVVLINGNDATCKKIKKTPEGVMLISINPAYEPMFYSKKDVASLPVRVIGKVVELRAKFK